MLQIDPAQKPRLLAIEANTIERLDEARSRKWLGEVNAFEESLRHIRAKRDQPSGTPGDLNRGRGAGAVASLPGERPNNRMSNEAEDSEPSVLPSSFD